MSAKPLIQARIDAETKEEAAAVLKAMGLTASDAVRMTLVHAAREKALPFEPPWMRTIERTTQLERDHMREMKGRHRATRPADLTAVISDFAADRPLAPRLRDPALTGNENDHRDCHVKPDLVPIDRRLGTETLQLVRLGSHAERGFRNNGPARNRAPMRLYRRLHRHSREVPVALFRGAAHDEPS